MYRYIHTNHINTVKTLQEYITPNRQEVYTTQYIKQAFDKYILFADNNNFAVMIKISP